MSHTSKPRLLILKPTVCKAWNSFLRHGGFHWGVVPLLSANLRTLGAPPTASCPENTVEAFADSRRWLMERSAGIKLLQISLDNSAESSTERAGRRVQLAALLGCLTDLPIDLSVTFSCLLKEIFFIPGSPSMQGSLSARLVSLDLKCFMDRADFRNLAKLQRLGAMEPL
ncbi:hypothetical protein WJX73_010378 [Symbiochloris irregularis]|uniref:Uncharacterized protein n=1 Tax=Symbiochloris irregularis TaxID=706552 RepID=A0AAW1NN72_9CHLO